MSQEISEVRANLGKKIAAEHSAKDKKIINTMILAATALVGTAFTVMLASVPAGIASGLVFAAFVKAGAACLSASFAPKPPAPIEGRPVPTRARRLIGN